MKISELKQKRFKIYVGGKVERTTNWKGIESLLERWSYVPQYTASERSAFFKRFARRGRVYIDANITVVAIKSKLAERKD